MNYTSDSSKDWARTMTEELHLKHSVKAVAAQSILSTIAGHKQFVEIAKSCFSVKSGDFQIHIIINNNNYACGTKPEAYDSTFNTRGRPSFTRIAAKPYLPTGRSGRIVNISSMGTSAGLL